MKHALGYTATAVFALVAGAYISIQQIGDVVPVRNDGGCVAFDTDAGKPVGQWNPVNGRCAVKDWRLTHPFG